MHKSKSKASFQSSRTCTVQSWRWGSEAEICSESNLTAAQTACVVVLKGLHWEYRNHCSPPASSHGTLMNSFAINFKRSPKTKYPPLQWCEEACKKAFTNSLMTPRISYQMLLKRLQSTDTYIPSCFDSSVVSFTHVLHCTDRDKASATAGEENWLKVWSLPSSENIFFCLVLVVGYFCWSWRNCTNKHCIALWVREERGSTLQQTEVSGKDGYSPPLSHPSQAHRLLQPSHCAKQFALQKIMFSFEDLCSASASYGEVSVILLYNVLRSYWTSNVSFHSNLQRWGPLPSTDLQALS